MGRQLRSDQKNYLLRETVTSILFNSAFSALFVFIVFGGRAVVPVSEVAFDALPQSFMVVLMSTLVPTLLTRRRLSSGAVAPLPSSGIPLPRNLLLRALLLAVAAASIGGGMTLLVLPAIAPATWEFGAVLAYKIAYGAALALILTPLIVRRALSDSTRTPSVERPRPGA